MKKFVEENKRIIMYKYVEKVDDCERELLKISSNEKSSKYNKWILKQKKYVYSTNYNILSEIENIIMILLLIIQLLEYYKKRYIFLQVIVYLIIYSLL